MQQNRLADACEASGLSPDEIARRAGIKVYDLIAYMDGIRVPYPKTANRIGRVVGKTGAELIIGTPRDIGERMKFVRFDLEYSRKEMGKLLFVHQQTIAQYESLERTPSIFIVITYAEKFGVSLDWLLLGKGAPYA